MGNKRKELRSAYVCMEARLDTFECRRENDWTIDVDVIVCVCLCVCVSVCVCVCVCVRV